MAVHSCCPAGRVCAWRVVMQTQAMARVRRSHRHRRCLQSSQSCAVQARARSSAVCLTYRCFLQKAIDGHAEQSARALALVQARPRAPAPAPAPALAAHAGGWRSAGVTLAQARALGLIWRTNASNAAYSARGQQEWDGSHPLGAAPLFSSRIWLAGRDVRVKILSLASYFWI